MDASVLPAASPTLYSRVLDHEGNVLLDGTPDSHQALQDSTAYLHREVFVFQPFMDAVHDSAPYTQMKIGVYECLIIVIAAPDGTSVIWSISCKPAVFTGVVCV